MLTTERSEGFLDQPTLHVSLYRRNTPTVVALASLTKKVADVFAEIVVAVSIVVFAVGFRVIVLALLFTYVNLKDDPIVVPSTVIRFDVLGRFKF